MRKTLAHCFLSRLPRILRVWPPQLILRPSWDLLFRARMLSILPRFPNTFPHVPTFFKKSRPTRKGSRIKTPQAGPVPPHTRPLTRPQTRPRPLSPLPAPQLLAPGRSVPSGYVPPVIPCPLPSPNPLAQLPLPPPRPRPLPRFQPSFTPPQLARLPPHPPLLPLILSFPTPPGPPPTSLPLPLCPRPMPRSLPSPRHSKPARPPLYVALQPAP